MVDLAEISGAAKNFACTLYKNQPGALIPNPLSDALHMVWDNICDYPDAPGLPPPPSEQFSGGQCVCINYRVILRTTYNTREINTPPNIVTVDLVKDVKGPVLGLSLIALAPTAAGTPQTRISVLCRGTSDENCTVSTVSRTAYNSLPNVISTALVSVVRKDGQADLCGNPKFDFPNLSPPPPGGYNSPPTSFIFNDGSSTNFTFNLVPPPPPPPPILDIPPIVVNFNKLDVNFKVPVSFNFNGTVNFGGGGGSGSNFNQTDRDTINNINNTTNNISSSSNSTNNTVNNHYSDYTKDRNRDKNKPPLPDAFDPPKPATLPGNHTETRLAFVNVTLSSVPINAKTQFGDGAPDIYYAGWFEWKREGKFTPREPIHFLNNCFVAPVGVDGYAFTLYDGYQGSAVAVTNKE